MIRSRARWGIALALVLGPVAAGCGSDKKSDSSSNTSSSASKLPAADLAGSGSTFQQAFDESAIAEFKTLQPAVTVTYAGGGSGQGQEDLAAGTKVWAGTDSLVKDEDKANFKGTFLYFPTVAAPITVSYNLSGVDELQLSADTLAKIFQSEITTWDDPAIAADNPGVDLPSTSITVAHRAEGSGTTANFTAYLVKAAPDTWTLGTDKEISWPNGQQAGNANSGVAQIVKDTDGAVGYVDFSDAQAAGLQFASIKNADGEYVAPSLEGATAALEGAELNSDLTYDPLNASGADAYPITSPTFVMVYETYSDANTVKALKGWLEYLLGDGQQLAASVDFAGLPDSMLSQARAQIDQITTG